MMRLLPTLLALTAALPAHVAPALPARKPVETQHAKPNTPDPICQTQSGDRAGHLCQLPDLPRPRPRPE